MPQGQQSITLVNWGQGQGRAWGLMGVVMMPCVARASPGIVLKVSSSMFHSIFCLLVLCNWTFPRGPLVFGILHNLGALPYTLNMINNLLHVFQSPLIDISFSFPIGRKAENNFFSSENSCVWSFKKNCQFKIQLTMTPPHKVPFWQKGQQNLTAN
jgi:hypothetical protein